MFKRQGLTALCKHRRRRESEAVVWFFRVIEDVDGQWMCRHGRTELDRHGNLADALTHIRQIANINQPASVVVHHADGQIRRYDDDDEEAAP